MSSRGTWVVIALLALAATASLVPFLGVPDDDVAPDAPPFTAAPAPVRGVRVDGGRRRSRAESTPDSKVEQAPPARLLVRVQGAAGPREPIAGAAVYLMDASGSDWRAVTADAGTARFDELPAGRTVVHTEVAGKRVVDRTVELKSGEDETLDVVAIRVGVVRGIVRDPDGRPADTAWVRVCLDGSTLSAATDAVTDDSGGFEVANAPAGASLTLFAGSPGWADAVPIDGIRLEGEPPAATRDIVLRRLSSLVVRIVGPDGQPVGATVWLDGRNAIPPCAKVNEYSRERIAPGEHTVVAESKEFPKATRTFSVAPGERADIELRFEPGVAIEGIVVDENGAPVANASVIAGPAVASDADALARRAARMRRGAESAAETGASGTFRLAGLAPGEYALTAATESSASEAFVTVRAPASGVRVPIVAFAGVSFRVVGDGDIGVIKTITVSECAAGAPPNRAGRDARYVARARGTAAGISITVNGISRSARALMICGDECAPVVVAVTPVPGRTIDLGDVRVGAGVPLKGRIVATDGSAVAGVEVYAALGYGGLRRCTSRDDGTFVLEHLAPGPIVVRASTAGLMGVAVLDVAADAPRADVVVRTVGVLEGVVRDGKGAAVARADVRVRYGFADADDEAGMWQDVQTGVDGRFAAPVIAGRCLASAGGAWVSADVAEGGKASVTLEKP